MGVLSFRHGRSGAGVTVAGWINGLAVMIGHAVAISCRMGRRVGRRMGWRVLGELEALTHPPTLVVVPLLVSGGCTRVRMGPDGI